MPPSIPQQYPGESATDKQILRLAEVYRKAAHVLLKQEPRGDPLSLAPCRLLAIHAIELYLNALLLHKGHKASDIRGMQHSLAERSKHAIASGLKLRKRTADHLAAMEENREYLVTRYSPEMTATVSQINRLTATLEEVANKATAMMGTPHSPSA